MTEPVTVNRALIIPNTGDLPGTWGSDALNPDLVAVDGILGGAATISLTNANVTLTAPAGFTATPSPGPTQSQNAFINLNGTLTGSCVITFPMPGFYLVNNRCVVGNFVVYLEAAGAANAICAPPGEVVQVFSDGTNMWYVGLDRVGAYMDIAATAVPNWISLCSVPPYLNCNGATFSAATYPALAAILGGTTLPDARGKTRFTLNQGSGILEQAGGTGINGDALLATGGNTVLSQANLPNVAFTISGSAAAQDLTVRWLNVALNGGGSSVLTISGSQSGVNTSAATNSPSAVSGTAASGGSGASYVPPGYVGGLTLIRAG